MVVHSHAICSSVTLELPCHCRVALHPTQHYVWLKRFWPSKITGWLPSGTTRTPMSTLIRTYSTGHSMLQVARTSRLSVPLSEQATLGVGAGVGAGAASGA